MQPDSDPSSIRLTTSILPKQNTVNPGESAHNPASQHLRSSCSLLPSLPPSMRCNKNAPSILPNKGAFLLAWAGSGQVIGQRGRSGTVKPVASCPSFYASPATSWGYAILDMLEHAARVSSLQRTIAGTERDHHRQTHQPGQVAPCQVASQDRDQGEQLVHLQVHNVEEQGGLPKGRSRSRIA